MKLSNIFKKGTKSVAKANVEKMDKKQLEKVVGGVSEMSITDPSKPMAGGVLSGASSFK